MYSPSLYGGFKVKAPLILNNTELFMIVVQTYFVVIIQYGPHTYLQQCKMTILQLQVLITPIQRMESRYEVSIIPVE